MGRKADLSTDFAELRRKAEAKFENDNLKTGPLPTDKDIRRLVHELQVHQIELEMQNEELNLAREELENWLERYTDLYDFAPVGYFTLERDGGVSQANLNGAMLLETDRARLVGKRFGLFVAEDDVQVFNAFLGRVFTSQVKQACEVKIRKNNEEHCWVEIEAMVIENRLECRAVVMDIQARKIAELKLQHLSMHDALTGLYNRSYFEETIEQLERGRHYPISVLMADVDHLKLTNDQLGHAAGDEQLRRTAQVLTLAFRAEDVIARIGGDEFVVLLPDTNAGAAEVAMSRLGEILKDHNIDHFTENPLHLSIGIATAEYGTSLIETLKKADEAMYHQKRG